MNSVLYSISRIIVLFFVSIVSLYAQPFVQTRDIDGLRQKELRYIALTNITLVPEPGKVIQNATIIVRDQRIEAVGTNIAIPAGATVRNMRGAWIYAGFVESYSTAGLGAGGRRGGPAFPAEGDIDEVEKPQSINRGARYWNETVHPEFRAAESVGFDDKAAGDFHKNGFTAAQVNSGDGLIRGASALVLARPGQASDIIVKSDVALWMGFRKGSSRNPYPSSLMGSIALLRQALLDAQWYESAQKAFQSNPKLSMPETNISLEALAQYIQQRKPVIFETDNEHGIMRAAKIAKEFGLNIVYEGSGREYRRLSTIVALKPTIILPVNFPAVPDVSTPDRAENVALADLKGWDAAPANPAVLDSAGIRFAFTMNGLRDKSDFLKNIRRSIQYGLNPETALAALTTVPARLLGAEDLMGTVSAGKLANLIIADGNIFESGTIKSVYVAGEEFIMSRPAEMDIRGAWRLNAEALPQLKMNIEGKNPESPSCTGFLRDSVRVDIKLNTSTGNSISFSLAGDSLGFEGSIRFTGQMDSLNGSGYGILPTGRRILWTAKRDSAYKPKNQDAKPPKSFRPAFATLLPDGPFGLESRPPQRSVLIRNATLWTAAKEGILKETDLLISGGKIAAIGKNLSAKADTVIDATGLHVSPGIIDEHSHIAIESGVNEGTHAVTAEVRIGDVLQPDDINIYRQLAGGVTASHLLHGSANPIGGQLQLIKLRWGEDAESLKMDFPGTIKFALGENVKQSNWGERFTTRYPQTRMGVEEIMRDGFRAALEYEKAMKEYQAAPAGKMPPKPDIQLETLLEIVRSQRFIHCHSYVQSEILMLIRLAEEFGFKINTFTHILEGYKLAREMSVHGSGGSTFSDWWGYKFEVYDAIPQNSGIMHEQGVTVAVNSDDAEMARRLNQEAGKSVKYGNVPQEEAIKFVTINPAKLLKVDDKTGSLEIGKDADIVLWTGNPLSNFSRVEQTYVDGRRYFDRQIDEQLRKRDRNIRAVLEQRAIEAAASGEPVRSKNPTPKRLYDCEDVGDEVSGFSAAE
jgi:imidazolonepropionase-like amidohydrolase